MTGSTPVLHIPEFTPKEADVWKQAQEMSTLFSMPAFQRILAFMEELEKAALQAMEDNESEAMAWPLQQRYRVAKKQHRWLLRYINIVKDTRRELLEKLLEEANIPSNAIAVVGALLDHNKVPVLSKPEAFR